MDGADPDRWSDVAADWAELWGGFAAPLWRVIVDETRIGPGSRVLDVGCGSGDFIADMDRLGASTAGVEPAPGMVEITRARVTGADVRLGSADDLPWPDASFDVVTAFNALQFADDTLAALAELGRVTTPGGLVVISNWADWGHNDVNAIEDAVARAAGHEPLPDGVTRLSGGLERLFADGGLHVVSAGLIQLPWEPADDDKLVRGVLLGEDPFAMAAAAATVITAARPFRTTDGGYRLVTAFRYAIGRSAKLSPPT